MEWLVVILTISTGVIDLVEAQISASTLPCKSCLGLEGYVWCGSYASPVADTWCDNVISDTVCATKIAVNITNCDDIEYDPVNGVKAEVKENKT